MEEGGLGLLGCKMEVAVEIGEEGGKARGSRRRWRMRWRLVGEGFGGEMKDTTVVGGDGEEGD